MQCWTLAADPAALPLAYLELQQSPEHGPCLLLGQPAQRVTLHSYRAPGFAAPGRLANAGLEGHRPRREGSAPMLYTLCRPRDGHDPRLLVRCIAGGPRSLRGRGHRVDVCLGEGTVRVRGVHTFRGAGPKPGGWDDALCIVAEGGALFLGGTVWQHEGEGWTRFASPEQWREQWVRPWAAKASPVHIQDELRLARERGHEALAELLQGLRRAS